MSRLKEECSCRKCMTSGRGIVDESRDTRNYNPFSSDELDFFIFRETPMDIRELVGESWRNDVIDSEEEHRDLHNRHTFFEWNNARNVYTCRVCGDS